jgi:hypothetical protein
MSTLLLSILDSAQRRSCRAKRCIADDVALTNGASAIQGFSVESDDVEGDVRDWMKLKQPPRASANRSRPRL